MPPGVQPPVIVRFSASSVPVIQLALTSTKDSLNKVYDYAQYRIRQRLTQVPGSTLPSRSAARRARSWSISTCMPCARSA